MPSFYLVNLKEVYSDQLRNDKSRFEINSRVDRSFDTVSYDIIQKNKKCNPPKKKTQKKNNNNKPKIKNKMQFSNERGEEKLEKATRHSCQC